jgi:hypothetical protein
MKEYEIVKKDICTAKPRKIIEFTINNEDN